MARIRLQKIIAAHGCASRRGAEELIREGRITVNGKRVTKLGSTADPAKDHIRVDGRLLSAPPTRKVYLLYKPRGVICTLSDPKGRSCVGDLIKKLPAAVFHVGRLDTNTEGLLLLTNDGDLSNRIMHPSFGCAKVYDVRVRGNPEEKNLKKLSKGVVLDGRKTAPCVLKLIREGNNSWLRLELKEGRTHQIKRMFERIGHPVSKIKRIKIGPLTTKGLKPGQFRELTSKEVEQLEVSTKKTKSPRD
ncbi:pseudouridine synthase [Acidobacteriota bacterium]